jgi:RHS repeat-associated protein
VSLHDCGAFTVARHVLNRPIQQTDLLSQSATFAHNAGDLLTCTTDRESRVRNLSHDALNRKTGETWVVSGSTANTQTFTYDAADNQLTARDASGTYTMAYDTLNRMTSEQEPFAQALTFSYDAANNRTQVQDSQGGVTTSVYDALGRLTSRKFSNGTTNLRVDPGWTNRDQLSSLKRYTDLGGTALVGMSSYTYDGAMRVSNITHTYANNNVLASYAYGYDQASRLTSETVNGTQTTYGYDNTDQLTTVNGVTTYSYDLNGNRTMTGYSTQAGNEMTNDGTFTYTYDNEGNLTQKSKGNQKETWYYGYDSLNRLTTVRKTSDGTTNQVTATYTYDVFGNRIEEDKWVKPQSGNGVTTVTRYAYDGHNAWADLNNSNQLLMRRLYLDGVDQPFARVDASNVAAWYLTDHLGSVRDILDKAGATLLDHLVYDGYGNITTETAPITYGDRYKYTDREWDSDTTLQYNRARYHDPRIGRWISQDPLGAVAGLNFYKYANNQPTLLLDPSGLFPQLGADKATGVLRGDLGAIVWGIKWKVKPKAESRLGGFIVQHIAIKVKLEAGGLQAGKVPQVSPLLAGMSEIDAPDYWEAWIVDSGKSDPSEVSAMPKDYFEAFKTMKVKMPDGIDKIAANDWYFWPWDKRAKAKGEVTVAGEAWYFELPGRKCKIVGKNEFGDPWYWSDSETFLKHLGFQKGVRNAMAGTLWYVNADKFTREGELMAQMHSNKVQHDLMFHWDASVQQQTMLDKATPESAK